MKFDVLLYERSPSIWTGFFTRKYYMSLTKFYVSSYVSKRSPSNIDGLLTRKFHLSLRKTYMSPYAIKFVTILKYVSKISHYLSFSVYKLITSLTRHQFGSQLREFQRSSSLYASPSFLTSTGMGCSHQQIVQVSPTGLNDGYR